jgi:hypothetical protein
VYLKKQWSLRHLPSQVPLMSLSVSSVFSRNQKEKGKKEKGKEITTDLLLLKVPAYEEGKLRTLCSTLLTVAKI